MTDTKTWDLRMTRHIPASPDEVFDAYTDAEKQKTWFSLLAEEPGIVEIEVDLRVGGRQTAVWGPSRDQLFRETQVFQLIDRPHRVMTTSTGNDPEGNTMTTKIDVTFEEQDGGTLMTVAQTGFPTEEMRDFFTTYAWVGAFDRITAFFERR
jgi:uncharacterized protein YndB with AHSA1/START domain